MTRGVEWEKGDKGKGVGLSFDLEFLILFLLLLSVAGPAFIVLAALVLGLPVGWFSNGEEV